MKTSFTLIALITLAITTMASSASFVDQVRWHGSDSFTHTCKDATYNIQTQIVRAKCDDGSGNLVEARSPGPCDGKLLNVRGRLVCNQADQISSIRVLNPLETQVAVIMGLGGMAAVLFVLTSACCLLQFAM